MSLAKSIIIILLILAHLIGQPSYAFAASLNTNLNSFNTVSRSVIAQTLKNRTNISPGETNRKKSWEPPDNKKVSDGFWARLRGLARRGSCYDLSPPLLALIPTLSSNDNNIVDNPEAIQRSLNNEELENFEFAGQGITLTLSSQPNLWFYIPEQARDANWVELMVQDVNGDDILDNSIQATIKTGLVSFQLPETLVNFELNQPYHWYFSVVCDPERPSRNPNVDGWIERVDATALGIDQTKLEQLPPEERLDLYSKFNIWNETVTLLAEERCLNRQNPTFVDYWNILLDSSLPGVGRDWIDPLTYCAHPQPLEVIGTAT